MELKMGIVLGIMAMTAWGIADLLSTQSGRTLGVIRGTFWFHVGSLLFLLPITPWFGGGNQFKGEDLLPLASVSILFMGSYLLFLRALEKGLLSIVSPIFGSHVVIPMIAGVVLFGERLNHMEIMAISIILVGIVLVSLDWREIRKADRSALVNGMPEAIGAMILAGLLLTLLTSLSREYGWFRPLLWMRIGGFLLIGLLSIKDLRMNLRREALKFAIPAGFIDILAFSLFSIGVKLAPVTVVAPISGSSSLVSLLLAHLFLSERLTPNQWVGVVVIFAGLVLLGIQGG
jgi:drug/metabolite transporter (DMT)-like permease